MRPLLLASLIILCQACPALAQVAIKTTQAMVLISPEKPEILNDNIVVIPTNSYNIQPIPAAIVTVQTESRYVTIRARKSLFDVVQLTKVKENTWMLTQSGKYLIEVMTFDPEKGIDQASTEVTVGGSGPVPPPFPPPTPPTPPTPPPTPTDPLLETVRGWSQQTGDALTAQAIAGVYKQVREAIECGRLTTTNTWDALKASTDQATQIVASGGDWNNFRLNVSDLIATSIQQGKLNTPEQVGRVLYSIQQGLELSANGTASLDGARMNQVVASTNEVINGQR